MQRRRQLLRREAMPNAFQRLLMAAQCACDYSVESDAPGSEMFAEPTRLLLAERREAVVIGRVKRGLRVTHEQQFGQGMPPYGSGS